VFRSRAGKHDEALTSASCQPDGERGDEAAHEDAPDTPEPPAPLAALDLLFEIGGSELVQVRGLGRVGVGAALERVRITEGEVLVLGESQA